MNTRGFENSPQPNPERTLTKEVNGQPVEYAIQTNEHENNIKLFDSEKNEIGKLIFSIPSKYPEKFRVQDIRINSEVRGSNLGIELYKDLVTLAKQKDMKSIVSANHVSFAASALWKKLQDEGYQVVVNPEAEIQFKDFCDKYDRGQRENGDIMVKGTESVFELIL